MPASIRAHLTFSNVVAFIALALALGGVSYAAVSLPAASVGKRQLKRHAVTGPKLAAGSVHKRALSSRIRKQLKRAGTQGPAGPGAARIHYFDQASTTPTKQTVLNAGGLEFKAACQLSGTTTGLVLTAKPDHDAVIQDNFNLDTGTDPHTPGATSSSNIQIDLPGGVETSLGGPGADPPNYFRVIATAIYVSQGRVMTLTVNEIVDGTAGTCAMDGTAVPST